MLIRRVVVVPDGLAQNLAGFGVPACRDRVVALVAHQRGVGDQHVLASLVVGEDVARGHDVRAEPLNDRIDVHRGA